MKNKIIINFYLLGYCINACSDVSSGTASPYNNHLSMTLNTNTTCICQCNSGLPLFREDLNLCVSDIQGKFNLHATQQTNLQLCLIFWQKEKRFVIFIFLYLYDATSPFLEREVKWNM